MVFQKSATSVQSLKSSYLLRQILGTFVESMILIITTYTLIQSALLYHNASIKITNVTIEQQQI